MKRALLIGLFVLAPVLSFAQEQQGVPPAVVLLQNMVGQLAGQNAMLVEQFQKLTAENSGLKQQLAAACEKKPETAPPAKK